MEIRFELIAPAVKVFSFAFQVASLWCRKLVRSREMQQSSREFYKSIVGGQV